MSVLVAFIPVACGIAILRYRLYDLDRIISRTAAYAIVTECVQVVYALVVTSVPRLFDGSSTWAVAAATLVAAALVRPLLYRMQRVVDRRFNRERVDGKRAVEEFGRRLTDELDRDRTLSELIAVSRRTMAPQTVSVWIPPE